MREGNLKKYLPIGIASLLFLIIPVISHYMMERENVRYQQSLAGYLYQMNPDFSEAYLTSLFETEVTEENLAYGDKALLEYGYTAKGMYYFSIKQDRMFRYVLIIGTQVLLCSLVFAVLYSYDKRAGRLIEEQQKHLEELEKKVHEKQYIEVQNKRLQTFIENIAHQIKTPVSRVMTSLELLEENYNLQRIRECYGHLDAIRLLTSRLIDIGRMEAGKVLFRREKMELEELIFDSIHIGTGDIKRAAVQMITESDTEYYGDYEWLKEALANIFKNCAEHDAGKEPFEVVCRRDKEYYMIRIRDHGCGFDPADIPNLFNRFYLPQNVKKGHIGIGMNLTKLIIEGHHGTICASNHEDGGAEFSIMLPMYRLKNKNM